MIKLNEDLLKEAVDTYGIDAQLQVTIEECAELIVEIARIPRNRTKDEDLISEVADVMIMVNQLTYFFGKDKIQKEVNRKLDKINKRLDSRR